MKPLAANTLLQNRYLIVHLIGRGGMGDVYLAIDQRLGSAVALKRTFFSGDELMANAFEREARTLARLRHNVLPKVSDHFTEGETQYLIMEHISGDDLAKRLEISRKPFPIDWVMFWADQLLDALNYLHSQEPPVIHRDIKPQNLKLTEDNSVVLLDFGLSKNTLAEIPSLTSTSSVVGYTPHFAPLEQIRGMGTNARSDIYSLSATLYQLLTNAVPPETLVRAEELLAGKPDPIKPVNEINLEVSEAVSDIILKGMEVSQEKRFPDAREMQKALRSAYTQTQDRDAKEIAAFTAQNSGSISGVSTSELRTNVSFTPQINESGSNGFAANNSKQIEETFSQSNVSSVKNLPSISPLAKTKSNNKFFTIVGFGAPFVLAIAIGIGWFLMRDSKTVKSENSFPTPEAVVVASPIAEPTVETAADSISNENASNSSVLNANESVLNENSFPSNAQNEDQSGNNKPQNPIDQTPKSTPQVIVKTTPKTTAPTTKSTPKTTVPSKTPKATPLPRILP